MIVIDSRNINHALPQGISLVHEMGVREASRNGDVLRMPMPVATVYSRPNERVCLHDWRDANPFFHLVEAMWMLAGRDDLKQLTPYVPRMSDFSDDGGRTQPGAYGKRWRSHHSLGSRRSLWPDQLDWVVQRLWHNPNDRRTVIQMWDPLVDIAAADADGKDVPCNITALPWAQGGKLNLTVFCRSNDMMLGAYGANVVHFSFLLEYLAGRVGLPVGKYWQVSNNFHAYVENAGDPKACWPSDWGSYDPYTSGEVSHYPMFKDFDVTTTDAARDKVIKEDLQLLFEHGPFEAATKARWPFIARVVVPMMLAHRHFKTGKGEDRFTGALDILQQVVASDWRRAGREWIERRHAKWKRAQDDGVQHG